MAEQLWLASTQHGHYAAANDYQLFLTVNQHWLDDLFHSKPISAQSLEEADDALIAAGPVNHFYGIADFPAYDTVVHGMPTAAR